MPAIFHVKIEDESFDGAVNHIVEASDDDTVWHCEEAGDNFDGAIFHVKWAEDGHEEPVWRVSGISRGTVTTVGPAVSPLLLPDAIADSLSYVKAFGGTEQRNIPQPYTQVNYVTNTAQTAVDTGIMIDFAKNYEFEVECRAVSGSWYILQSRASSSGNITGIHGATSGSTITLVVGNVTVCTSAITRTVGNKLYVKATLNAGTATLYVKDETANTEDTQTGSYGTSQPNPTAAVYLLGNAGEQYVDVNSDIYMARIKENDTVVMDYVPARQVATAGFYDKASGTFKTALTPANLSAGGEAVPTPDAPMDIVSNNGVLKARHQSGLPLGYTLLDYATFDGTQVVDTGLQISTNDEIRSKLYATAISFAYGADTSNPRVTLFMSPGGNQRWGTGVSTNQGIPQLNTELTIIQNKASISYNGTSYSVSGTSDFTTISTLTIGNCNGNTSTAKFSGNFYYMEIYQGGSLVAKMLPVKASDDTVGFYNLVRNRFFAPITGTLVAGNPVSDPVEIYTDGTVETVEVDTTGDTATAEMLLKVGDYQDEQEILSGAITRKVGVKVLDGTENWQFVNTAYSDRTHRIYCNGLFDPAINSYPNIPSGYCTNFPINSISNRDVQNLGPCLMWSIQGSVHLRATQFTTLAVAKQWLAEQYAAGTPVIIVYPLATETTGNVTGQTLQVTDGDNVLEITQASIDGLELEAKYMKGVVASAQEVEPQGLDNNVSVSLS